jgi:hypothetical protein
MFLLELSPLNCLLTCFPGFTGKLCDTEIKDGCKSNPCYAGNLEFQFLMLI